MYLVNISIKFLEYFVAYMRGLNCSVMHFNLLILNNYILRDTDGKKHSKNNFNNNII